MSHTLLDGVNEVLKRANVLVTGTLFASLTDGALQHEIDVAVQVINEGIDDLYSVPGMLMPNSQNEGTISLVLGQREYTLPSDFLRMNADSIIIDRTNTNYLWQYMEGYDALLGLDPQQLYTGLPLWWVISPITGKLRVDRAPDSTVVGNTYYFEYEKNVTLANASDAIPFNDAAFRAMVPAWTQIYKRERSGDFDQAMYTASMARAARFAREVSPRIDYSPR